MNNYLHKSRVINNLSNFYVEDTDLMRNIVSMLALWNICKYFKPKRYLEIGFNRGQTCGMVLDSGVKDITAVDIDYSFKYIFDELYEDQSNITFIEADSKTIEYEGIYDLVLIDGNHSYAGAKTDLIKVLNHLSPNSIIAMDDYKMDGVSKVIEEELMGQNNFVPFLVERQCMYFHHAEHNAADFIDNYLIGGPFSKIMYYNNVLVGEYTVLEVLDLLHIFTVNFEILQKTLEYYDL